MKQTVRRAVDQVIGHRQKKKGMTVRRAAWSAKGSKTLAVLRVVELNGRWQQLWFPPEPDAGPRPDLRKTYRKKKTTLEYPIRN